MVHPKAERRGRRLIDVGGLQKLWNEPEQEKGGETALWGPLRTTRRCKKEARGHILSWGLREEGGFRKNKALPSANPVTKMGGGIEKKGLGGKNRRKVYDGGAAGWVKGKGDIIMRAGV